MTRFPSFIFWRSFSRDFLFSCFFIFSSLRASFSFFSIFLTSFFIFIFLSSSFFFLSFCFLIDSLPFPRPFPFPFLFLSSQYSRTGPAARTAIALIIGKVDEGYSFFMYGRRISLVLMKKRMMHAEFLFFRVFF